MTNAEQQKQIDHLCEQIEIEKDNSKIAELARELNDLLEAQSKATTPH
jgi:hypothetical protein